MNPCPCGYYTHPTKACVCSPGQVQKYLNRISGPLLDRIDLQIEVTPLPFEEMADSRPGESSATIRERVIRARQIQEARYADIPGIYCNAQMNSKLLARHARPDDKGLAMLKTAMNRLNLSARAYDRILTWRKLSDIEIWIGRTGQDKSSRNKNIKFRGTSQPHGIMIKKSIIFL